MSFLQFIQNGAAVCLHVFMHIMLRLLLMQFWCKLVCGSARLQVFLNKDRRELSRVPGVTWIKNTVMTPLTSALFCLDESQQSSNTNYMQKWACKHLGVSRRMWFLGLDWTVGEQKDCSKLLTYVQPCLLCLSKRHPNLCSSYVGSSHCRPLTRCFANFFIPHTGGEPGGGRSSLPRIHFFQRNSYISWVLDCISPGLTSLQVGIYANCRSRKNFFFFSRENRPVVCSSQLLSGCLKLASIWKFKSAQRHHVVCYVHMYGHGIFMDF